MKTFKTYLTEKLKTTKDESIDTTGYLKHTNTITNDRTGQLYDDIHDHPDIAPQNFTAKHKSAIATYTFDSGKINKYLDLSHTERTTDKNLHNKINEMSSVFSRKNTNRKPIITYSGIPTHIGKKLLESNNGTKHTIARFTSTSTNALGALNFASLHAKDAKKELHLLQCYNEPGATLSVAKQSTIPDEDEMVINHGAHVTYFYSTKHKNKNNNTTIYIHHIKVHDTHTPLEDYGKIK